MMKNEENVKIKASEKNELKYFAVSQI